MNLINHAADNRILQVCSSKGRACFMIHLRCRSVLFQSKRKAWVEMVPKGTLQLACVSLQKSELKRYQSGMGQMVHRSKYPRAESSGKKAPRPFRATRCFAQKLHGAAKRARVLARVLAKKNRRIATASWPHVLAQAPTNTKRPRPISVQNIKHASLRGPSYCSSRLPATCDQSMSINGSLD